MKTPNHHAGAHPAAVSHELSHPGCGSAVKGRDHRSLSLSDLVSGDIARIVRIHGTGAHGIRQRLLDMGVTRGTTVQVERHAPLGDPVEITVKGYSLALRMSEARDIEVERL